MKNPGQNVRIDVAKHLDFSNRQLHYLPEVLYRANNCVLFGPVIPLPGY